MKVIAHIVNEELSRSEFNSIRVQPSEFAAFNEDKIILSNLHDAPSAEKNFCTRILEIASPNRAGSESYFYHFKPPAYAIQAVRGKTLLAVNLLGHSSNDNEEYSAFMRLLGRDELFSVVSKTTLAHPWAAETPIDDIRTGLYILCLTKANDKVKFWNEYAAEESGACFALSLVDYDFSADELMRPTYMMRDVMYDDGTRFSFFRRIEDRVKLETGKSIVFSRIPRFASFYKRASYSWEQETRIAFNHHYSSSFGKSIYGLDFYENTSINESVHALRLPLFDRLEVSGASQSPWMVQRRSPSFKLVLEKIILGKKMNERDRTRIQEFAISQFPSTSIEICR